MASGSSPKKYVKIWAILLVLFCISVIGPEFGIKWLTLITAFGIAFIKAYLVITEFMHLNVEKKVVVYMLGSMIMVVIMFFFGVAGDVMNPEGSNWKRVKQIQKVESHK
jgi:caa(3)-type oxidase subunit IV